MENPARLSRPGFQHTCKGYLFVPESRFIVKIFLSDRQISGQTIFREKFSEKFSDPSFLRTEIFRPGRIVFIHAQSRARRFRLSVQG